MWMMMDHLYLYPCPDLHGFHCWVHLFAAETVQRNHSFLHPETCPCLQASPLASENLDLQDIVLRQGYPACPWTTPSVPLKPFDSSSSLGTSVDWPCYLAP